MWYALQGEEPVRNRARRHPASAHVVRTTMPRQFGEDRMTLLEQIDIDLKQAMRERDDTTKLALRAIKTALTEAAKSGENHELDEAQIQAVIQKQAKQRRDAAAEFEKAGAHERAAEEQAELSVLERYLPQQMNEAEIEAIVRAAIAETGATSPKEMGKVMSVVMPKVAGRADGRQVNGIARRLLGT